MNETGTAHPAELECKPFASKKHPVKKRCFRWARDPGVH